MKKTILALALSAISSSAFALTIFDGVSTRGVMGHGEQTLIVGFCNTTRSNQKIIVGALGAEVTSLRYPAANTDIVLKDVRGRTVASNRNYVQDYSYVDTRNFLRKAGVIMLDSNAAITRVLAPGCYTLLCTSANGWTGIGFAQSYSSPKLGQR